jgi:hypothetical protein
MYNSISGQDADGYGQGYNGLGESYNGTLSGGDPGMFTAGGGQMIPGGNSGTISGGGGMTPGQGIPGPRMQRMHPAGGQQMQPGSLKPMLSQMLGFSPPAMRAHPGGGPQQRRPITRLPVAGGPRPIARPPGMHPGNGTIAGNGPSRIVGGAPAGPGRVMAPGRRTGTI